MVDNSTVALIGITTALAVSFLTAIILLILYSRLKIKNDTNIRRRVIAVKDNEPRRELIQVHHEPEEIIERIPMIQPLPPPPPVPVYMPPPPPPVQHTLFLQPVHEPPPPQVLPPPPPPQPEVVVHQVIHRYEPAPTPAPPQPQRAPVRRQSWGGEDDWVLVKKVTKNSGKKNKVSRRQDDYSSESSSDEEDEVKRRRRHKKRLDRYDLASNIVPMGFRPQMTGMMAGTGLVMAQPTQMMAQPMMAQPMMATAAAAQPIYTPFFSVQR